MKGRKPKPDNIRVLQGNKGKRPIHKGVPRPENEKYPAPDFLSAGAKAEWTYISGELFKLGMLAKIDRGALAAYCQTYDRWQQTQTEFNKDPQMTIKTSFGNVMQNPLLGVINTSLLLMHKFLVEFGMTPSSRGRLSVVPPQQRSLLAEYLGTG